MSRVIIVGAGITGLSLAFRLQQRRPDLDLLLLEATSRPGGNLTTIVQEGFQLDLGPNGFLDNKPSTFQLCKDLGLHGELTQASEISRRKRFVFWNGRMRELPGGPLGLLTTTLLSWRGKSDLLREPWRPRGDPNKDESIAEFFRRRIGGEATQLFVDALVTGIHGGDAELLSMRAAFTRFWQMEQEAGSIIRGLRRAAQTQRREAEAKGDPRPMPQRMWSFRSGIGRLPQRLAEALGSVLRCESQVQRIERSKERFVVRLADGQNIDADSLVLACPAYSQADLLRTVDPALAGELAAIAYAPIAVVSVGFRESDVPNAPSGFGYIAPQQQKRDLLGVQWCSSIFPERAPTGHVLWRALCGGWSRQDVLSWSDERLTNAVLEEMRLAHGCWATPMFRHVHRWPRAIPQYFVGHTDRVARIESLASKHGQLYLTGNALRGVAINDCTEEANRLAENIASTFPG
jgi:oxygen-dependent protoporphyrinogen oxidase